MSTITLNVGSVIFESLRSTLEKSQFFENMFRFNEELINSKNPINIIFIVCNSNVFNHILKYLRFANYKIPKKYEYLCEYFMIDKSVCGIDYQYKNTMTYALDKIKILCADEKNYKRICVIIIIMNR